MSAQLRAESSRASVVVLAPFLSAGVLERLIEADIGYMDLTGNIRITLSDPGLFILTEGATKNPYRRERATRTLRGAKAGRIIRVLLDSREPPGVREIAKRTDTNPGYVSRILSLLDRLALITREGRGRLSLVDWLRLLRRWAEEAPIELRGRQTTCIEPRGVAAFLSRLRRAHTQYAVTGGLAACRLAPVAPPRLATVYVGDAAEALRELELREASRGANVLLIEAADPGVFAGAIVEDGLTYVAPSQAAADLLTSPGRGPNEGEALLDWMAEHEEVWRG